MLNKANVQIVGRTLVRKYWGVNQPERTKARSTS